MRPFPNTKWQSKGRNTVRVVCTNQGFYWDFTFRLIDNTLTEENICWLFRLGIILLSCLIDRGRLIFFCIRNHAGKIGRVQDFMVTWWFQQGSFLQGSLFFHRNHHKCHSKCHSNVMEFVWCCTRSSRWSQFIPKFPLFRAGIAVAFYTSKHPHLRR